jgi:hypothetical protein
MFLTVSPLLFSASLIPSRGVYPYHCGDDAILEIYTLHASHGTQMLGPYSRFQWNHPGPALFYVLLPLYKLSGQSTLSLYYGALVINVTAILAMMALTYKAAGAGLFYWTAMFLGVYMCNLEPRLLTSPWNPFVTILPFGLVIFLCAAFSQRGVRVLPALVVVATFVIQTHIEYLPNLSVVVLASFLFYGLRRNKGKTALESSQSKRPWVWFAASCFILAAMWMPPILEEVQHDSGNLTKLYRFFVADREWHSFFEAIKTVSIRISAIPPYSWTLLPNLAIDRQRQFAIAIGVLQMLLLAVAYWTAMKQQKHYNSALCLLGAIGGCMALVSVISIAGHINPYLVLWVTLLGIINWCAIADTILPSLARTLPVKAQSVVRQYSKLAALGIICFAAAVNISHVFQQGVIPDCKSKQIEALYSSLQGYLETNATRYPLIRVQNVGRRAHDTWSVTAGVILQLYKAGIPFSIEREYLCMFGKQFEPTGTEEQEILFGGASLRKIMPYRDCIAQQGNTVIYASGLNFERRAP